MTELEYAEGARCLIDYRSMLHDVISREFNIEERDPSFDYHAFFASTDAVLDAQEALAIIERQTWPSEIGERYLWLYGSLQAITIIREGVIQLCSCFRASAEVFKRNTKRARDLRVMLAGHPAQHDSPIPGASFLVRSVQPAGNFKYGTFPATGNYIHGDIDVVKEAVEFELQVNAALGAIWNGLGSDRQAKSGRWR